jgi:hypothetical protein
MREKIFMIRQKQNEPYKNPKPRGDCPNEKVLSDQENINKAKSEGVKSGVCEDWRCF